MLCIQKQPTHTHTASLSAKVFGHSRAASCSVQKPNDLVMRQSPGETFHAFSDEPNHDSKCVHFHTWMEPLPISSIASPPLIPIQLH